MHRTRRRVTRATRLRTVARRWALGILLMHAAGGCDRSQPPPVPPAADADARGHTAPAAATIAANAAVARELPLADAKDFEDARRGFVASDPTVRVQGADGSVLYDDASYAFVTGEAPPSVNPSLWRQAKLNGQHGLFTVAEGVHQVRGYDISNLSLIRGRTGWIVVDPLASREAAEAAMALARKHLDAAPVVAIVLTHSHVDHFGGIAAVLPADPAARARVRIVAPRGFTEEATSENVLAGLAMGRRALFMYGFPLDRGPRGHVDTGLGRAVRAGSITFADPTELIDRTPQPLEIDGVRFVFQYTPESEAPAELTFYLPDHKAFCGAEIVSRTMHNLYTLRGAKVRDALKWGRYIDEAITLFADMDVIFNSHGWPVWGHDAAVTYLKQQRDTYRYLHDQTLRLANAGLTPQEIAETVELPSTLQPVFANRGYYGTVRHNVKAVYQAYFGWYDANPAHLNPLPPVEAGQHYVEAMGGAAEVLRKGREAIARGEYRWAATLLNHLVFAEPANTDARGLLAQAYDQLGYQAESGPWRDVYLTGALELRHGPQASALKPASMAETLRHLPVDRFLLAMATRLDGTKADGKTTTINMVFTDVNESWVLSLENAVLHHHRRDPDPNAAATVNLTRDILVRLSVGTAGLKDLVFSNELSVEGSRLELLSFLSLFDRMTGDFPIVTP